jgi:hypothetical protein
MSQKKKRNKKYNIRKTIRNYVLKEAEKIYCYDGKCFPQMQLDGANPRRAYGKEIMYSVADDQHHWSIWLGVFQDTGVEQYVTTEIYDDLEPAKSNELTAQLTDELDKLVATRNKHHVTGWGWFAIPMRNADLKTMEPGIIDKFRKGGAFDRERCETTYAIRKLQGDN